MTKYTPVRLAFKSAEPRTGSSEKPPVIFAHGFSGSSVNWTDLPQIVADATKRKVYAIDARNHGDSEWNDVFNFDCNVDDLLHFMDCEKISKAVIVGASMGGITGMKTALREPGRVEKLIVEDMNVQKLPQSLFDMTSVFYSLARDALRHIQNETDEETAKRIVVDRIFKQLPEEMKRYVNPELFEKNPPVQLKRGEDGRFTYKANQAALEKATRDASQLMSEYSGTYEGPSLFLYGKLSPFQVAADKPNIRKHFPNAEFVEFEKASHTIYLEFPQEFTEALLNFIGRE